MDASFLLPPTFVSQPVDPALLPRAAGDTLTPAGAKRKHTTLEWGKKSKINVKHKCKKNDWKSNSNKKKKSAYFYDDNDDVIIIMTL